MDNSGTWATLLKKSSTEKSIPLKKILVLGDRLAGMDLFIQALVAQTVPSPQSSQPNELLSFAYFTHKDEDLDSIATFEIYSLVYHANYMDLLSIPLNSLSLKDTLVIIYLDWSNPTSFLSRLNIWLSTLQSYMETNCDHELLNELKNSVEMYWRNYQENPLVNVSGTDPSIGKVPVNLENAIPLGDGVLKRNVGLPIVIVAAKSDQIIKLENEFQEEQFDFIQQALRSVALSYGASLFYISLLRPETITSLKSYLIQRLLCSEESGKEIDSSINLFHAKPQVIERDLILVPTGWDSLAKIKLVKPTFPCEAYAGLKMLEDIKSSDNNTTTGVLSYLVSDYESVIPPPISNNAKLNPLTLSEDEQEFLERQASLLKTIESTMDNSIQNPDSRSYNIDTSTKITPPIKPATFNQPSNQNTEDASAKIARLLEKSTSVLEKYQNSTQLSEKTTKRILERTNMNENQTNNSSAEPAADNEMLNNFFQSLLVNKKVTSPPSGRKNESK
ncbi:dynein light intermediate chain-domain-containing protein [Globomyces pollinis-pini]|nr:dynein light intermediate chain-domain-containing protein [Globomyces pollinis-pini]